MTYTPDPSRASRPSESSAASASRAALRAPSEPRKGDFYAQEARRQFGLWLRNAPKSLTEAERFEIVKARVEEREAGLRPIPERRGASVRDQDAHDAACYQRCRVEAERQLLDWVQVRMEVAS